MREIYVVERERERQKNKMKSNEIKREKTREKNFCGNEQCLIRT